MKRTIVSLILILCFIFSVFALSSCGKNAEPADTTAASATATESDLIGPEASEPDTADVTTVETTADKWEDLAPKIAMIVEKDRALRIECSSFGTAEKTSKNDIYLKGPDEVVDGVTPLIQQMVYERNKAAYDLLGTSTEFVFWDIIYGEQCAQIDLVVKGGASDAPDLFVNMLYDLNLELLNGSFKDIWSIAGSFFDFSTEGWLSAWMENLSLTGDRAYILGSDYFMDVFRAITILPFNMDMMDENGAILAPAILEEGETLGQGEELTTFFFDLVDEGRWTWDVLGKLCEAIWVDSDGNGQDSINDRLGIIATEYGGQSAGSFIHSSGEQLTEAYEIEDESSEYYGKQWIRFVPESTELGRIFDAVKSVFEGPGSMSTNLPPEYNTPEAPGAAYFVTKFAASEMLFAGVCQLSALEDETFQQMRDLYSVVPCPKVDATKSYNTVIYNDADVGAINVNANPRKARALSAYLQYCTENSPAIREQFLQIVTKYKTTTYNQGTDRMLEIIYDGITYGRDKAVEDLLGQTLRQCRWHAIMKTEHFTAGSSEIAQQYQSLLSAKQKIIDADMKKWYTLPKAEPASD
ncbi:MAG: hypothetical protein IKX66_05400 [Clostridia bacterium]|nr:hypothetical protein [Clostridia bacterium]